MTHAICLACAGSPLSIGRAPELFKFVKNNKQDEECFVEVDILKKNEIVTIRRVINSVNKSSFWYLNGVKKKESDIKNLMNTLSIDMNNLCSFMAQDRVSKFTRLTPKEVLQETLKCITYSDSDSGKTLYEVQQELANFEENKLKSQEVKTAKQAVILQLEIQMAQLKGDVDRMSQRQELLRQLEVAKLAEKMFSLQEIDKERQTEERVLTDLQTQLAKANERITPLEATERDLKRRQQISEKAVESAKNSCSKVIYHKHSLYYTYFFNISIPIYIIPIYWS
jgi:structural maintenance of chromosomes protein 5